MATKGIKIRASQVPQLDENKPYYLVLSRITRDRKVRKFEGEARLHIQRDRGEIALVTPILKNMSWADYNPKYDLQGDDFIAEDYLMEIYTSI